MVYGQKFTLVSKGKGVFIPVYHWSLIPAAVSTGIPSRIPAGIGIDIFIGVVWIILIIIAIRFFWSFSNTRKDKKGSDYS